MDASVVIRACLAPDGLDLLSGHELLAPPLLWSEASSVLHESRWRGEISSELGARAMRMLGESRIQPRQPEGLATEAWRIADRLGWAKTYDAEYVALAAMTGCALMTIDARLAAAARRIVEIADPPV